MATIMPLNLSLFSEGQMGDAGGHVPYEYPYAPEGAEAGGIPGEVAWSSALLCE
jgi:hypothetical protein